MEILLIALVVVGLVFFVGRLVRSYQQEHQRQLEDNARYIKRRIANHHNMVSDTVVSQTTSTDNFTGCGGDFGGGGASG